MQLVIKAKLEQPVSLPLAHHHMLQAVCYHLMREPGLDKSFYHDTGVTFGDHVYRLFTFGPLQGLYRIKNKRICFQDEIIWEVRSEDVHCLQLMEYNLHQEGLLLGGEKITDIKTVLLNQCIEEESIIIAMRSPICVYETNLETKYVTYYAPDQRAFVDAVVDNFVRKYYATYDELPYTGIAVEPLLVNEKDKYVTRYKNYYITGWKGIYRLSGRRKYLDFLYQTGLGAKNAQGFGMFDLFEDE